MSNKKQQPIFPEQKTDISRDTAVTIGSILESYNERGQHFASEGIEYTPIKLLTTISNLYLIKKYNTNCFMYGDQGKDDTFMYGGIVLKFLPGQLELPIERIIPDFLSQINSKNLLFQINNFLNCVKNSQPIIIIPLLLEFADGTHHANMLIYRQELNTIEHFEPHGSFLDLRKDYGDKITAIIQLIIDKINETNNNSKSQYYNVLLRNINLTPSNEVCLYGPGLQAIQQQLRSFSIEGPGYCQMWSLLFAEMALLNPSINSKNILEEIYKLLETQDGSIFLSNVIRGYVSMLGDEISLYLSEYINNAFTIENISYICRILFPYARYLSEILTFIVYIEVNVDLLFRLMPKTMAQLDDVEARLQGSLSNYFRLQNELKELLINRKKNYSIHGKDIVNAEIVSKLRDEYNEYAVKKRDVKNFVQNRIFQNYLRNKQKMVTIVEKKTKSTSTAIKAKKKVEEVINAPVIVEEPPKRGRKKTVEVVEENVLPAATIVEETNINNNNNNNSNQRKSSRNTKKGGKKYKKIKSSKTKKYKRNKKYKSSRHSKF